MDRPKQMFLLTMLVNVVRVRNHVPDQVRMRLIIRAEDEQAARSKIGPLAKSLAATYDIDPIDTLDSVEDLPELMRRYCRERGFELAATAPSTVPNCS